MYTLKDKVSGSLSRLFSDSPNHSSPSSPSPADLSQARWYSKGPRSFSSIFSYIIPTVSLGGSISNDHGSDLKPIHSLPVRWKNSKFEVQDESLDCCKENTITYRSEDLKKVCEDKKKPWTDIETKQFFSPRAGEEKDRVSERSSSDSDEFHEAREQHSPVKASANLSEESVFITCDLYEFLMSSLPNIVKGCQWMLLYSTLKHGISLRTLIRKSAELPGPCLLITGDKQEAVFGAMLECPLKPTPKRKYQGTNQTFVFTTIYGEPRLFRPTGANRYYYICLNDLLALGGGSNFALRLDGDLLSGTSGPCETFGNLCLAHNEDFELKNVEEPRDDLYGEKEPWELWEMYGGNNRFKPKDLYFVTRLKMKTLNGKGINRTIGSGTWKGEDSGKPIFVGGFEKAINFKKLFRYEGGSQQHSG